MKVYTISEESDMHIDDKSVTGKHLDFGGHIKMKHSKTENDETKTVLQSNKDVMKQYSGFFQRNMPTIVTARNYGLLILYLAFYSYAMYCNFGDEGSIRLTVFTGFGVLYLGWNNLLSQDGIRKSWKSATSFIYMSYKYGSRPKVIRWCLYLVWAAIMVYYLISNVALKDPGKLRSLGGYIAFILILVIISNNRRKINWHCVVWGSAMQCLLGYFIIKTTAGATVILWLSDRLMEFMDYSRVGAKFVFGDSYMDHRFAMQAMPSVIVFFAAIQVLIYLGTIQFIVRTLGKFLAIILDVSAPEATNACANIFLGGIESAILVIEYIDSMPTSRLFTLMTNWFASCGGSALIQFISFGVPASYLLAASAMSAPAALVCAKITFPMLSRLISKLISKILIWKS
ncbi:solute carrier family 28 member 3-like [Mercenaria mercenaria]|uniref:solute carrier family 28 member 3-like n=1 Tax=Mercenaria mercenaria TaxID=6596 RepID=UPI00234EBA81|nr:solute carrier family 28 member 3-like [Mercenaria mercenaria]